MSDPFLSPTFCFYPFLQMSTVPAGFVKPCCYFEDVLTNEGQALRVDKHSYQDLWNGVHMRDIRQKMAAGEKLAGCSQCYREEQHDNSSMRLRGIHEWSSKNYIKEQILQTLADDGYSTELPKILELKPGNQCNLKCRMCNKFDSNQIGIELEELAKQHSWIQPSKMDRLKSYDLFQNKFELSDMADWGQATAFWKSVDENLPHLERLGFAGGETSLIKEVRDTLRKCVATGVAPRINVFYTSNLTKISDELLELGRQFRTFTLIASIDGIGEVQEYIRYPSKWQEISTNFIRIKQMVDEDQWRVIANFTVQINNICNMVPFLDWLEELDQVAPAFFYNPASLNLLTNPHFLNIDFLPVPVREKVIAQINDYCKRSRLIERFPDFQQRLGVIRGVLAQPPPADYKFKLGEFLDFTAILDQHRAQNFCKSDPYLYHAIQDAIGTDRHLSPNDTRRQQAEASDHKCGDT